MKTRLKVFFLFLSGVIFLSSCEKNDYDSKESSVVNDQLLKVDDLYDSNSNLKRAFGKALVKSLVGSKSLRDLIKKESLKMFDNDYEVLYQLIKDEKLENNITVRESILKNLGSEALLNQIEFANPTLTILVPQLPENSFSAQLWDTQNQVPRVAIRLTTSNDVPIINIDGSEEVLEARYIPSFPVIVIKDNERLTISNKESKTNIVGKINGRDYKFLDDCFDGSKKLKNQTSRTVPVQSLDQKIITAYNTYNGVNVDGWQRDYIYYGITPSTPKGPFKYDFQESIKSFSLQGDPTSAYLKIADQTGDPRLLSKIVGSSSSVDVASWVGGSYEFKIRVIVNGKNGIGSEIVKYFNATVYDLFDFTYIRTTRSLSGYYWERQINGLKTMNLNIPIFNWDLDQYASTIKIDIEEIDLTETTVLTDTRTVEFANNFNVDAGFGTITKIGLKYGTSLKTTTTSTVQRTFTQGNDLLGDVIVNFADNVIISTDGSTYTTREYSSGLYSISVEPVRVQ